MDATFNDVLTQVSSTVCRNEDKGFTDISRLLVIQDLLKESPFSCVHKGDFSYMFAKKDFNELPQNLIVISTHVDVVKSIKAKKAFSEYDEETDVLKGTYDNGATNAACVLAMQQYDLPDNVIFAFNADEETGGCKGCQEVFETLHFKGKQILPIALDVTNEISAHSLYSLENVYFSDFHREKLVEKVLAMDGNLPYFAGRFVPLANQSEFKGAPVQNISHSTSWFDEGAGYHERGLSAMSFCLPLDGGNMHSPKGCYTRGVIFEGYVKSLVSFVYTLTKTHDLELSQLSEERSELVNRMHETYLAEEEKRKAEMLQNPYRPRPFHDALHLNSGYDIKQDYFGAYSMSHDYYDEDEDIDESFEDNGDYYYREADDSYGIPDLVPGEDYPLPADPALRQLAQEWMDYLVEGAFLYDQSGYRDFYKELVKHGEDDKSDFKLVKFLEECEDYPKIAFAATHTERQYDTLLERLSEKENTGYQMSMFDYGHDYGL